MLFVLALFINPLRGLIRRSWMFTPAELAQMFVMWIAGSAMATCGFVSYILPEITTIATTLPPKTTGQLRSSRTSLIGSFPSK